METTGKGKEQAMKERKELERRVGANKTWT
jgi:hypothetical protein